MTLFAQKVTHDGLQPVHSAAQPLLLVDFHQFSPRATCSAVTVVRADKGFSKEIVDDLGDVR
jgi:hypothetical protein